MKKHLNHNTDNALSYLGKISESFDSKYSKLERFKERLNLFVQKTIKYTRANGSVCDLGCGSGVISYALAKNGYQVKGIDGSTNMLDLAKMRESGIGNPTFVQMVIPFSKRELDTRFETVISSSVLEYIGDFDKTIQLVKDLLIEKGIFIVSVPNRKSIYRHLEQLMFNFIGLPHYLKYVRHKFTRGKFISAITNFGFECLEYEFFASKSFFPEIFVKILPAEYCKNMLVCVFRKL